MSHIIRHHRSRCTTTLAGALANRGKMPFIAVPLTWLMRSQHEICSSKSKSADAPWWQHPTGVGYLSRMMPLILAAGARLLGGANLPIRLKPYVARQECTNSTVHADGCYRCCNSLCQPVQNILLGTMASTRTVISPPLLQFEEPSSAVGPSPSAACSEMFSRECRCFRCS